MTPGERSAARLLLDEHVWEGLAVALRELGFDAVHVYEVQRGGEDDEAQLEYAAQTGRAILTFNARHFETLAARWFFANKSHAGIIISDELPLGELMRRTHLVGWRQGTKKSLEPNLVNGRSEGPLLLHAP